MRQIFLAKTGHPTTHSVNIVMYINLIFIFLSFFLFPTGLIKQVAFFLLNTCRKETNMQLLYWVLVFHKSCCSLDWKSHWKSKEPCIRNEWNFTYSKSNYGLWLLTFLGKKIVLKLICGCFIEGEATKSPHVKWG